MAATRIIEEERGVYVGHVHTHNGYYAGDFSRRALRTPIVPNTHPVAPIPALPFLSPGGGPPIHIMVASMRASRASACSRDA